MGINSRILLRLKENIARNDYRPPRVQSFLNQEACYLTLPNYLPIPTRVECPSKNHRQINIIETALVYYWELNRKFASVETVTR